MHTCVSVDVISVRATYADTPSLCIYTFLCERQQSNSDEIGLVFGIAEDEVTVENAFVLEDHKLGVAFSAGPQLFRQARTRFHELNPLLLLHHADNDDAELAMELIDCTRAVLLISADFYTAWNTRYATLYHRHTCVSICNTCETKMSALNRTINSKELVCRGALDALAETRFCDLVFTLHPKSIDTWAYRRWLATRLLSSSPSSFSLTGNEEALNEFYHRQLSVCALLAEQKPRNYHAWSFRHWIVSQLPLAALEREVVSMQQWCAMHITDHSGWNHRQHVVTVLLRRWSTARDQDVSLSYRQRAKGVLVEEYAFLSKIMGAYPAHEALWCHRRFVVQLVLQELVTFRKGGSYSDAAALAILNKRVSELEARVRLGEANAHSDTGASPSGAEALSSGWQDIETSLYDLKASDNDDDHGSRLQVLLAMISEVEIAWGFGSRYSRRFALWSLERVLQVCSSSSSAAELHSLAYALRECLSSHDPLLQDLWENKH